MSLINSLKEHTLLSKEVSSYSSFKKSFVGSLNSARTDKNPKYLICKEILTSISVVIYSKKDFYFLDSINDVIKKLNSAGLIEFWRNQHLKRNSSKSRTLQALSVQRLVGCFQLLAVGLTLSIVTFFIEKLIIAL
jgi:hypothetical protein